VHCDASLILYQGFLAFSMPGATVTLSYQLKGCEVINDSLLKCLGISKKIMPAVANKF
jgi:hypothetical protein